MNVYNLEFASSPIISNLLLPLPFFLPICLPRTRRTRPLAPPVLSPPPALTMPAPKLWRNRTNSSQGQLCMLCVSKTYVPYTQFLRHAATAPPPSKPALFSFLCRPSPAAAVVFLPSSCPTVRLRDCGPSLGPATRHHLMMMMTRSCCSQSVFLPLPCRLSSAAAVVSLPSSCSTVRLQQLSATVAHHLDLQHVTTRG